MQVIRNTALPIQLEQVIDLVGKFPEALTGQALVMLDKTAQGILSHQFARLLRRQRRGEFTFLLTAPLEHAVK